MARLNDLIQEVALTRKQFIAKVTDLTYVQATFKPSAEVWSITEIVEHIAWAERSGVHGIWKAISAIKYNQPIWSGESVSKDLPIEVIIERTWKIKEMCPDIAQPRYGGPIKFWIISLRTAQSTLDELKNALKGMDINMVIYPHPISGPLDVSAIRIPSISYEPA